MVRPKKILYVDFGGLGDHLAFSTLPEICDKNGYDLFLNSKSKFRDNQIFELVRQKLDLETRLDLAQAAVNNLIERINTLEQDLYKKNTELEKHLKKTKKTEDTF